ncbi:hypothetical protein KBK19_16270 [Microvirga sp. STR05]|uniref:Uncharacterized protein n=1 Tax=Hymenobacter duratus TaxID=2771356 RepID=A0ABR8JL50_9BACT|nr:hypothetical protein [Hymenobacter duratus]MBD2716600.1 hypothetical protein [Hymenobacter duratus]MBR7951515.1 hypothetical protein [Microvirga sp. STR05]
MLDFYLIHDDQNPSSKGFVLERVGGIEDGLFFQLQAKGIIEPWYDYYGTFRWGSEIVACMLLRLKSNPQIVSLSEERKAFMVILQKAVDEQYGLMGYGD